MNDEFKALTIGDIDRIADRLVEEGIEDDDVPARIHTADVLVHSVECNWKECIDAIYRVAREILAERTSSEALKRAARVEELDKAAVPGPWLSTWDEPPHPDFGEHDAVMAARDDRRERVVGTVWYDDMLVACSREHAAFIAETRTIAPALAADVRVLDTALRELVEALDERETAVPKAEANVDAIARTQKERWDVAQRARDRLDMKEYQRQVDLRNALDDSRNAARRERDDLRIHREERVNRAIDAARRVLG